MNGVLIVDKPVGFTSHDVVARLRRVMNTKKIGHTGTLDPFATGVLVVLVGKATRLARFLDKDEKRYEAVLRFGYETETGDRTGEEKGERQKVKVKREDIERVIPDFVGEIEQVPPMYSAKKLKGRKLYELARKGVEVERKPVKVTISELRLVDDAELTQRRRERRGDSQGADQQAETWAAGSEPDNYPDAKASPLLVKEGSRAEHNSSAGIPESDPCEFTIDVTCSAGTYIRVLAEDIGQKIGVGCHLSALRRVRAGKFEIAQALSLKEIERLAACGELREALIPMNKAVSHLPERILDNSELESIADGRKIAATFENEGVQNVRLTDHGQNLVAIGEYDATGKEIQPRIVFLEKKSYEV